jgi:hypothetical protein
LAVEAPERTVTDAGTAAAVLELDSVTLVLLTALPLRVTVHDEAVGGVTLAGLHVRLDSAGAGVRVSENVFDVPVRVAVMTAVVLTLTDEVFTVKLAVDAPERTVTDAGTVADVLELDNATEVLLAALPLRVTVHDDAVGGVTLAGLQARLVSTGLG